MVFIEQPQGFTPTMEVVGCFVQHGGKVLFLHRQDSRPQGNTWNVPGGKIDKGESAVSAMRRELFEETNYDAPEDELLYFKKFFVRYPEFDFVYHVFSHIAADRPEVILSKDEHKAYIWTSPEEALELDLIPGEDFCIRKFFSKRLQCW